ncbi:unnamed protein product, partial [Allacma fusca]
PSNRKPKPNFEVNQK